MSMPDRTLVFTGPTVRLRAWKTLAGRRAVLGQRKGVVSS